MYSIILSFAKLSDPDLSEFSVFELPWIRMRRTASYQYHKLDGFSCHEQVARGGSGTNPGKGGREESVLVLQSQPSVEGIVDKNHQQGRTIRWYLTFRSF